MPRAAVKGGEVGAVDTNWKGTSGLEFLFLTRLNGGWLEAAEIIVCSMLVAHNETGAVSGSDGLAGKVLDLKGGSDWLTGTWRGIRENDTRTDGLLTALRSQEAERHDLAARAAAAHG